MLNIPDILEDAIMYIYIIVIRYVYLTETYTYTGRYL